MRIECYGGPLDGVALLWRHDLPSFGPDIYLRMHRGDGALAVYVGGTRRPRAGAPVMPTFRFLGVFSHEQYESFPGKPVWTAPVERVSVVDSEATVSRQRREPS